ncbi:MAG: hypothetical protein R3F20_04820 [Planctomycetota bacterium]
MIRWTTPLVIAGLILAAGCASPDNRAPDESQSVAENWGQRGIVEIAVLPVSSEVPEETIPDKAFTFPEDEARHQMRTYLIRERDYAVPTSAFVDQSDPKAVPVDAELTLVMEQWDSSRLQQRGVVYAGGRFTLRAKGTGEELWTYGCRDKQISVPAPHGGYAVEANMRDASLEFVRQALSRLPRKTDFDAKMGGAAR